MNDFSARKSDWRKPIISVGVVFLLSTASVLHAGFTHAQAGGGLCRDSLRHRLLELQAAAPARPTEPAWLEYSWAQTQLHLRKARHAFDAYYPDQWSARIVAAELNAAEEALASHLLARAFARARIKHEALPGSASDGGGVTTSLLRLQGYLDYGMRFIDTVFKAALSSARVTGPFEFAYWCELDGSAQPYVGHVPASYDGRAEYPLLVYLHGYSPSLDIINWSDLSPDLVEAAESGDFLLVAPFARGNTDFQGIGERDVLRVIEEMHNRYRVDRERVILVGYSMGGMGAWTIAAHYPHLFAGALIVSGRACYYTWHDVRRERLPYYKQAFIDMEFGHSLLPNLANISVLYYHGANDFLIPVREARTMARALRPLNPNFIYREIAGGDHWIFDRVMRKPDTRRWLAGQRLQTPEAFSQIIWHPRYRRAHWLSLPADIEHGVRHTISVTADSGHLIVSADNTDKLWLHYDLLPESVCPERIKPAPGLTLSCASGERIEPNGLSATTMPRGPAKEFFLSPFMFVQAGIGAPGSDEAAALRFENRCREWEQYAQAPPRRSHEMLVSDRERQNYNLFLFGEPEDSPMIREALEKSPIRVTSGHFIIGNLKIDRANNGLLMVYRSPWNEKRLTAVQCGQAWGGHLSVNHRYDYLPDFIVYAAEPDRDGSNRALAAGFFDEHWRLQTDTFFIAEELIVHTDTTNAP